MGDTSGTGGRSHSPQDLRPLFMHPRNITDVLNQEALSGLPPYPSFRPSMGRGTRPPRSRAEVMLSKWSAPGSQRPPKAVRKRLAGVEGRTSSTSWLRTRNSAWYGNRGPGEAKWALSCTPSCAWLPGCPLNLLQAFP